MISELTSRLDAQLNTLSEQLAQRNGMASTAASAQAATGDGAVPHREVQKRFQYLKRVAAALHIVAPETLVEGQVGFGSQVEVEDLRTKELCSYTIMSGEGLDLDAGEISIGSPVAQALLGHREGDEVTVVTPHGRRRLRILSTVTLFDALEMRDLPKADVA